MIEILSKPIFYRSAEQHYTLDLILRNFPGFSRYSKQLRMKIVEKAQLCEIGARHVIVRQGHVCVFEIVLFSVSLQTQSILHIQRTPGPFTFYSLVNVNQKPLLFIVTKVLLDDGIFYLESPLASLIC